MHSLISRCLILGSLFAVLVTASARHPSAGAMAAFVHPKITTHGRGGIHESSSSSAQPHRNSRTRGERVKGVNTAGAGAGGTRLFMAPAKKQVAKKKTTEVESFKKSEFVASISEKTGFTRAESEEALTAVLDTLTEQMMQDKKITLVGFGSFQAKERAARKGRNPRTGEELDIAASRLPSFTASKALKDKINGKE